MDECKPLLHGLVANHFLPSAVKFHYQWNLRELSNISQAGAYTRPLLSST